MKSIKICSSVLFFIMFFLFCSSVSVNTYADSMENTIFTIETDKELYEAGNKIKLSINLPQDMDIGGFLITLSYDDSILSYSKENISGSTYHYTYANGSSVKTSVTAKSSGLTDNIAVYTFDVNSDEVPTSISVSISDICSNSGAIVKASELFSIPIEFQAKKSSEAKLYEIIPSAGTINEEFSPDVYNYSMSVPYSVKEMSFECTASDGASWIVNRKNLGSGGSVTDFIITVTAEDGVTKNTYTVSVTRGEYETDSSEKETSPTPYLLSLVPSSGELSPQFDPETNTYTCSVPYSVQKMSFECTASEGASWKVNRQNLGSGGSVTDFVITVTAEDGVTKNVYTVSVTRGEYQRVTAGSTEAETPYLLSLIPSDGTLTPEFDPEVNTYSISVPYEVKTMTFNCTVSSGASYSVSRKNLGSGGSTTEFRITVTASDEITKNIYYISVTRGEYVRSSTGSKSSTSSKSSKSGSDADDGDGNYVITRYENSGTLTIQNDRFIPFLIGMAIASGFILIFFIIAIFLRNHYSKKNRDDKNPEP